MFTYRTENAFSKALVAALKRKGAFVQRIESGGTGRGIPDLYCIINNKAIWLELKRVHHRSSGYETIPWRPGQQAWLTDVVQRGQRALTLCCFDDIISCIPHDVVHIQNTVCVSEIPFFCTLNSLISALCE